MDPCPNELQSESSMQTEKGVGLTVWAWMPVWAARAPGVGTSTARARTNEMAVITTLDVVVILLIKPDRIGPK